MTREQAQEILLLHRAAGRSNEKDAEMAEALRMAASDSELGRWLEQHREFQADVEKQIRAIAPPDDFKLRILAGVKVTDQKRSFLHRHQVWAIAAAIVVLFALSDWLLSGNRDDRSFANFRSRMSEFAVRSYQMDIVTNSGPAVRQFLASQGAPADFVLTPGLDKLPVKGGGRLSWQNQPVAMMCFSLTDNETAFMFVMDRSGIAKEPTEIEVTPGKNLSSVAWTKNGRVYLLAAVERPEVLQALIAP
jgi:hypothetical protein